YDIYMEPRNLREKLVRAAFATSGCEYAVRTLREVAGPEADTRIHRIVMGVDGEVFQRRRPAQAGRVVVAVGRLVEKKGLQHLVDAVALLGRRTPLDRLTIAGEGELRAELQARAH